MASKSKRRGRVFRASCILAALIIAGSSFAWFTGKDEVTNRLSASADYGVSIAESFQPPENWVPGQEVNKDAFATNTGNVDAFVRMYLEGKMRLLTQSKTAAKTDAQWNSTNSFGTIVGGLTDVVDTNLLNANLTKLDNKGNYFKTLDKTQTKNPGSSISTNNDGYAQNEDLDQSTNLGAMSEVQSMQSGILAYAPSGAKYSYVLDQETELEVYLISNENGTNATGYKKVQVPAGTLVIADETNTVRKAATLDTNGKLVPDTTSVTVTSTSGATHPYTSTVYIKQPTANFVPQNVEYESFTPLTDGLYLFLRNEKTTDQTEPEFSGYYVDGIDDATQNETPATGTYYALNTGIGVANDPFEYKSDYTVRGAKTETYNAPIKVTYDDNDKNIIKVEPTTNLELFNAQYSEVTSGLKWYYDDTATKERMIALYDKDSDGAFDAADDIAVIINLANIGTTAAEKWTAINGTTGTVAAITDMKDYDAASGNISALAMNGHPEYLKFYYNNDLESGDTTTKLVDKVKLYEGVKNTAYLAFDFDLNVKLDSVQVTYDENGKEADTAVAAGKGEEFKTGATTGGATGARQSGDDKEITLVTWTKQST